MPSFTIILRRFAPIFLFVALGGFDVLAVRAQSVHTLSIDDAINSALKVSEEVGIAQAGIRRAEGNDEIARSQFLPQISASAGYTRTLKSQYSGLSTSSTSSSDTSHKSSSSALSSLPFGKPNVWNLGLSASENVFTGGRLTAQKDASESRERSAAIDLTAAQAQLVLNVTQSYFDAVLSQTLVAIAGDALKQSEEVYKQMDLGFKVGERAEFDALRAKVSRDNQVPQLLQAEVSRDQSFYRLKQLMNMPLNDSLILTTGVSDSLGRFEAMSDTSTELRSSVIQAKENITASEAQVRVAESARWPQIQLSSRYAPVAYPDNVFPTYSDFRTDWTVGVNLSIPIYTGGYITGNEEVAKAGVDEANARLEQAREAAALDAHNALNDLRTAVANLRSTSSTASEAQRAYEIARVRFQQGISTQIELDDTRLQEEQARVNSARAIRNYQVARAKLSLIKDLPVNPTQAAVPTSSAQTGVTQQAASSNSTSFTAPASVGASTGAPSSSGQTGP